MHTCYVLADLVTERTPGDWGVAAASAAEEAGGLAALAELAGVDDAAAPDLVARVHKKLRTEPVEDTNASTSGCLLPRELKVHRLFGKQETTLAIVVAMSSAVVGFSSSTAHLRRTLMPMVVR